MPFSTEPKRWCLSGAGRETGRLSRFFTRCAIPLPHNPACLLTLLSLHRFSSASAHRRTICLGTSKCLGSATPALRRHLCHALDHNCALNCARPRNNYVALSCLLALRGRPSVSQNSANLSSHPSPSCLLRDDASSANAAFGRILLY